MRTKTLLSCGIAALAIAAPSTAFASENGPAPTAASVTAVTGPYTVTKTSVGNAQTPNDFGAANVWYPSLSQNAGATFGAIAIAPGFTENEANMAWWGPRLASQGFVVITFNTNSLTEAPTSRGAALVSAVKYLANTSIAKSEVDPSRLAVAGHSMGGGGVIDALRADPTIKTGVAFMPWETSRAYASIKQPTFIIGASADAIAPPQTFAIPFYNALTGTTQKAYAELNGASHSVATVPGAPIAAMTIEWFKRFLDGDTRYTQTLTGTTPLGLAQTTLSKYYGTFGAF